MLPENVKIEQIVLPNSVDGDLNKKGFYQYSKGKLILECMIPDFLSKKDLVLQEEFSKAPVIILFVAFLYDALQNYGDYGYKMMLQSVGAVAHYTWLQALNLGYEGTVFAGFLQKSLRKFSNIDGYYKNQMFAFAFGNRIVRNNGLNYYQI